MAFDGNGNYIVPVGTQGVGGQLISSASYNTFLADLQTAMTKALLRDGQSAALANIPMGGFKFTGLAAALANGEAVRFEQLYALPKATYTTSQLPSFSATLAIDASLSNTFEVAALTANITSFTITNPQGGQSINIRFVQDATGGRTVVVPTGSLVGGIIDTAANKVSWLLLTYSARALRWEGVWSTL